MSVSVTHNLSGPVSVYGTSFIMLAFGRHTVATAMIIVAGTRWPVTNLPGADLDARRGCAREGAHHKSSAIIASPSNGMIRPSVQSYRILIMTGKRGR